MNDHERYAAAAHRVQTAIAVLMSMHSEWSAMQPKHLRVGIDMTKSDAGGLATLLMEKGIITQDEYLRAIADAAEREADGYEKVVQVMLSNKNVRTL